MTAQSELLEGGAVLAVGADVTVEVEQQGLVELGEQQPGAPAAAAGSEEAAADMEKGRINAIYGK